MYSPLLLLLLYLLGARLSSILSASSNLPQTPPFLKLKAMHILQENQWKDQKGVQHSWLPCSMNPTARRSSLKTARCHPPKLTRS